MPSSVYANLGTCLAKIIGKLPEARIECGTKGVSKQLRNVVLKKGEVLASLDVTSLFTMVPVRETVHRTVELLDKYDYLESIDGCTMEELLLLACENIQILTHDGYSNQCDGVAMGSPLGPFLANIFMSQFDTLLANETERSFYHIC